MFAKFLYMLITLSVMTTSIYADYFDDALNAYDSGNYIKAFELTEQGCNNNDGRGCGFLSELYMNGQGVKQDVLKATALIQKSCNLGNAFGCTRLGNMYENG